MSSHSAASVACRDAWIEHPDGRLFARIWAPASAAIDSRPERPIVLFHDSLGCVDLWRDFPPRLCAATNRWIVAYDRLGFGKSDQRQDKLEKDFIAEEAARYFALVRAQLGFGKFIAFGHSVGGSMATHCAALFAEDCEALITESTQSFVDEQIVQGILIAKENFKDARNMDRLRKYHGDKAKWVLDAWIETWLHPEFSSWSLATVLPKVSCPVLAIHGDRDEYGSLRHPEMIGQLCGNQGRVEIVADTFHVPHRERPELILDLVAGFVAALRQA